MSKYSVINPASGETVKEYPEISDQDLSAALAAAQDAHQNWGLKTSVSERASLVRRVAELHSERRETLAEIIVREMGKPMEQALGEVDFCVDIWGFYADNARLSIVNTDTQHVPPFELHGKGEIAKHLRATFGQEASHRIEQDAAVGEDRVTFREACEYSDGGQVVVETTLEVLDGKIVRQVDMVASDAKTTSQERSGRGPPT